MATPHALARSRGRRRPDAHQRYRADYTVLVTTETLLQPLYPGASSATLTGHGPSRNPIPLDPGRAGERGIRLVVSAQLVQQPASGSECTRQPWTPAS